MAPLALCPECQRHLRRSETTCPFCSADLREAFAAIAPRAIPTDRLGRTALLAFAAANLGVAACGGETSGPAPAPETGGSVAMPVYGAPPPTGGVGGRSNMTGGASANTGGYNTGGVIVAPPYGIPPIPPGSGGDFGMAEYGAPPPPPGSGGLAGIGGSGSAGDSNTGGDMAIPIYGASPPKP
jgi:hypothetical protein